MSRSWLPSCLLELPCGAAIPGCVSMGPSNLASMCALLVKHNNVESSLGATWTRSGTFHEPITVRRRCLRWANDRKNHLLTVARRSVGGGREWTNGADENEFVWKSITNHEFMSMGELESMGYFLIMANDIATDGKALVKLNENNICEY